MRWCDTCGCNVVSMHKHWGLADYTRDPMTGEWFCRWCRAALKSNNVDCRCRGAFPGTALKEKGQTND